jgi:hypothetical protein
MASAPRVNCWVRANSPSSSASRIMGQRIGAPRHPPIVQTLPLRPLPDRRSRALSDATRQPGRLTSPLVILDAAYGMTKGNSCVQRKTGLDSDGLGRGHWSNLVHHSPLECGEMAISEPAARLLQKTPSSDGREPGKGEGWLRSSDINAASMGGHRPKSVNLLTT